MAKCTIDDLAVTVDDLLEDYREYVFQATERGLDAAEKILINNLKASSPKDKGKYAKSWKSKGKKYKTRRYVGNTVMVQGKSGQIPLSNILEYSAKSKHQGLIKATYSDSLDAMIDAMTAEIKKGG